MSGPCTSRFLARSRTAIHHAARPSPITRSSASTFVRPFSQTPCRLDANSSRNNNASGGSGSGNNNNNNNNPLRGSDLLSSLYGSPPSQSTNPRSSSSSSSSSSSTSSPTGSSSMMDLLRDTLGKASGGNRSGIMGSLTEGIDSLAPPEQADAVEPYHFHIFSTKHNTHVTVTKPDRGAIVSVSAGNIGFRKSRRGQYDAAYQLMAYVLERLKFDGWPNKINRIELVLRGYGQGRDAAVKVLMSPEGAMWRQKVVRVADSTRLKFGGTRSRARRRL
ncbi:translational machinery component [Sodiomyces alkalinus F11]|uniref:Translational machinery component n=1 Tax=Sodiomyces alkalinus (strain CBS 110278 / VKM F-3762 / F11) TaxID=1314773 RepID=A0A3N2Q3B2_SODAK|nr:translational machinery component [Sodiomyces alkalinus F11]ROT41158.1 translational machinery component [Sodiomyces alkalinus F11]